MKKDYIPKSDSRFADWEAHYLDVISADPASFGITPAELAKLQSLHGAWETSYPAHIQARAQTQAATEVKNKDRTSLKSFIRVLTKKVQANPSVTDAMRENLGVTVPDRIRTPLSGEIVLNEPPPVINAKCTASKTVRIGWYPTQAPGESEALPQGIDGVAIWVAEGGIPDDPEKWRFLTLDTNSPYVHDVGNADTVTLAYKAQWFDRRKRMGPFCDPVVVAVTP